MASSRGARKARAFIIVPIIAKFQGVRWVLWHGGKEEEIFMVKILVPGILVFTNRGYNWNSSMTINGLSVRTLKEALDRSESRRVGDEAEANDAALGDAAGGSVLVPDFPSPGCLTGVAIFGPSSTFSSAEGEMPFSPSTCKFDVDDCVVRVNASRLKFCLTDKGSVL